MRHLRNKQVNSYLHKHTSKLEFAYKAVQKTFNLMTGTVVSQIIGQDEVMQLYSKAYGANKKHQNEIRDRLYNMLIKHYEYLKTQEIKQFQFHLPNNVSFLRFNRPHKFGDKLSDLRYSVKMTNKYKQNYSGFEEGQFFNGFRNIFPLYYKTKHIGSVEIGFSFKAIELQLKQYGYDYVRFMLKKNTVNSKTFKNKKNIYVKCLLSDDYIQETHIRNSNSEKNNFQKYIDIKIKDKIETKLLKHENFTIYNKYDYLISFISVNNIEGKPVAYIYTYQKDTLISQNKKQFLIRQIGIFSLIFIIAFFVIKTMLKNKNILYKNEELHYANKKITESEEKLRLITTNMNDLISVISYTGMILYVSPSSIKFGGYQPEEGVGFHVSKFFAKKIELLKALKIINSFAKKQKSGSFELIYKAKNRPDFPVEVSYSPTKFGNKLAFVLVLRNVTEQKKTEKKLLKLNYKLLESEKKYRILFEKSEEATLIIDNGKFIDCNIATIKMLGYENKDKIINIHPSELSPIKQPDGQLSSIKADAMIKIAYETGTNKFEWIHKKSNGSYFPVEVWYTAIPYGGKTIIHTIWRDITEKKLAEQEIQDQNEELEATSEEISQSYEELLLKQEIINEGKRKYELVTDNIFDFIWMLDLNLNPVYISPSCKRFLGYSEQELRSLTFKDFHPLDSIKQITQFASEILNSKGTITEKHIEVEYVNKDGHIFPAEVYGFVVLDEKGKPTGFGGVSRNITEQKNAQNKLINSKEEIENIHKDILDNIRYAKKIQEALLTPESLINEYLDDYFLLFKPKDQVSGDFYYIKRYNEYIIVAVADCTGHGVTGGFITMLGITYLHEIVSGKKINNPADVLNTLRKKIKDTFIAFGTENPNGMDIAFCAINTKNNILTYSGAFNPLWIIRDNKLNEYKAIRNPIGFYPIENDFENTQIQLQDDDKIYLFSDGFQDQVCEKTEKNLNKKQFKNLLLKTSKEDFTTQKRIFKDNIEKRIGKLSQIDDITILGIKWKI